MRQDVFDAKMEALFNRFHGEIQALNNEINGFMRCCRLTKFYTEKQKPPLSTGDSNLFFTTFY